MESNHDRQEGVITFQEEKSKQENRTTVQQRTIVEPKKKEESVGRGIIAFISICVIGSAFAGMAASFGPTTGAGAVSWLLGIGIIALIGKWARWY